MDTLQQISRVYWPFFYSICFILHSLMFLLIYNRTTKIFTTLKLFLYPATFVNFTLATLAFATQVRNVNNMKSTALLCDGFCKYISADFCFNCYSLLLVLETISGLINLHTLFYRSMSLKHLDPQKSDRKTLQFSIHYVVPLITLVLTYIPTQNHPFVYMETYITHPDYYLEMYENFGGFADSHHFCMTFNTISLAITTIYVPIMGNYWKNEALTNLRSNISNISSNSTRTMLESLIKGLSLQILLPLCCYVPITAMYCWNKYSGSQFPISQYTISVLGTLPCIFDPCIQIYFISPYKQCVGKFMCCQRIWRINKGKNSNNLLQIILRLIGYKRKTIESRVSCVL